MTFGTFVKTMAIQHDVRIKDIATIIGISNSNMTDILKDRRYPPKDAKSLRDIAEVLHLDTDERYTMYDLAGEARGQVAPDLVEFIMAMPALRTIMRNAMDKAVNNELGRDSWSKINEAVKGENHD